MRVHVAVGVIVGEASKILLARRDAAAHQGGLWEFPGGKVEAGETVQQALRRELQEELTITARRFRPLLKVNYDYPDKSVLLDVWWVDNFVGSPRGEQGQPLRWVTASELSDYAFPPANQPIVDAVQTSLSAV